MNCGAFLEDYKLFSEGNETPTIYHIWTALSMLAGAVEKRLWIDRDFFKIFLNLYVLFIAPPGVCSKSTSMELGLEILQETGFNVLEDSVLKERIIEEMCAFEKTYEAEDGTQLRHSSVTFVADELNVLLSSGVDMIKFLVAMFNKNRAYHYKTKKSGVYEIIGPHFNLLGAAVDQWFGTELANSMASTGFIARCVIVYENEARGKWSKPRQTKLQREARQRIVDTVYAIGDMYGEVSLSKEADIFFDTWYNAQNISPAEDYRIASYLVRKAKIYVLKVAALLAVSRLRQTIEVRDIERALHIFDLTEKKMRLAYLIAGTNRLAAFVPRISALVQAAGGTIPIKDVVAAVYTELNSDDLKSILQTMHDMGLIFHTKIGEQACLTLEDTSRLTMTEQ